MAGQRTAHGGWDIGPSLSFISRGDVSCFSDSIHTYRMYTDSRELLYGRRYPISVCNESGNESTPEIFTPRPALGRDRTSPHTFSNTPGVRVGGIGHGIVLTLELEHGRGHGDCFFFGKRSIILQRAGSDLSNTSPSGDGPCQEKCPCLHLFVPRQNRGHARPR